MKLNNIEIIGTGIALFVAETQFYKLRDYPMDNVKKFLLIAVATLIFPAAASATFITGEIGLSGALQATCSVNSDNDPSNDVNCTMDIADGIDFTGHGWNPTDNEAAVTFLSGDFLNYADGNDAAMTDFRFTPFAPVSGLWTYGGFSFDLDSIWISQQSSNLLTMRGQGTISGNGFSDTDGSWSFSADASSSNFSWSSTTSIPEPGTLALLGLGLVGIGFAARKKA